MSLRKDKSLEKNKAFMRLALELANQNKGLTGLNPSVGCVVTHKDEIISYGKTDINGRPHAEIVALKNNKINFMKRRKGDIVQIYSDSKKFKKLLKWKPRLNDINKIIQSAINWEAKLKINRKKI